MSRTICVTPAGRLVLEEAGDAEPALESAILDELDAAFGQSSAHGLLSLVAQALDRPLPPSLVFFRQLVQQLFHDLCQFGDEDLLQWDRLQPPASQELETLIATAPPMRGLEYLTVARMRALWAEMKQLVVAQAQDHPGGIKGYLSGINPVWHLLGRVTFHLAENKRDERRPFAFLATYTHKLTRGARLQHLPLAQALKEYAGTKSQARLVALLEPVQRAAAESPLVRQLLDSRALFQPQAWSIPQAYQFLTEVPRLEAAGLVVHVPDWWNPRRPPRPQVQVRIGQQQPAAVASDSLLDFSVELALDGEPLTEEEVRQILAASEGLALLRGKWVEVNRERLQQALQHWQQLAAENPDGLSFIQGMRLLAGSPLENERGDDATADWAQAVSGEWLRETLQTLRDPSRATELQPGAGLQATLRPYQAEGVRWLWFMTRLGLGACLADDMGLGKTIQVIALIWQLKRSGTQPAPSRAVGAAAGASSGPSLLVVPASLIGNWKQELQRFAPALRVFVAHRSECEADDLARVAELPRQALAGVDVVITTYGLVRRSPWLSNLRWRLVVLDEAQAIKNASSAQTRAVKKIPAAGRIALTGTPVENHLGDVWSIFDFTSPGLLGSAAQFQQYVKQLSKQQDAAAYGALRRLVRPYILRRLKTDPNIVPDLPDKTEMRTECGLAKKQAVLYARAVEDLAKRLENSEGIARRGLILAVLMQLKQICNHPDQYLGEGEYRPADSGKFGRLQAICEAIIERQEKMLVFTQFQSLCEPLAHYLAGLFGRRGLVLTGQTTVRKRSELVREFQQDGGPPYFVISLKAGGSGLNLTAASHVVHFDRWWNPAVENQATDRAFRIGQQRNVLVHKFVCRGTLEERIDQMIRDKQNLADKLLASGGEAMLTEMADDQLLKFVALDLNRAMADE